MRNTFNTSTKAAIISLTALLSACDHSTGNMMVPADMCFTADDQEYPKIDDMGRKIADTIGFSYYSSVTITPEQRLLVIIAEPEPDKAPIITDALVTKISEQFNALENAAQNVYALGRQYDCAYSKTNAFLSQLRPLEQNAGNALLVYLQDNPGPHSITPETFKKILSMAKAPIFILPRPKSLKPRAPEIST